MEQKVAQIGLGAIGQIYLKHLAEQFDQITVFDADKAKERLATEAGATFGQSLDQTVSDADYVLVALPDPLASAAIFRGEENITTAMKRGAVVVDVSTIDPETARQNYADCSAVGIHYVEAPVSGGEPMSAGVDGAENANVTFMSGSDEASFNKALPIMRVLGEHSLLLGPAGTGSIVKLISNYISGLQNLVCSEAFALGRAAGIDPETLFTTFLHTDANSYWLHNYFAPRIRAKSFVPGFSVNLQHKDLRLCEDLARELKVSMPLNNLGLSIYRMLQAQGRGGNDLVDTANLMCELSGQTPFTEVEAC